MTAARRDSGARVLGAMVLGALLLGAMALTATTAAAQGLDQRIRAAATAAVTWVGYRVPMVADRYRDMSSSRKFGTDQPSINTWWYVQITLCRR